MKDCSINAPSDKKLSLNSKLLLIEVLVFFLPGLIIFYLYYVKHLSLDRSHLIILGSMLLMVLGGLVTIKQIFDRFLLLNNLIKSCSADANPTHFEGIQIAAIVAFSVTDKWPVFAGFGIEGQEGHTAGFFRLGTEYTFFLGKKKLFFIAPGTFIDMNLESITPSVMIALGVNW